MNFVIDSNPFSFHTTAFEDGIKLCDCRVNVDEDGKHWVISSWYATAGNNHKGYGKRTLKACLKAMYKVYGAPNRIDYIWNGANSYVLDWLNNHFGAVSMCPIAVQKYACEDDWESHIYILNKDKVLSYFELVS